ncbi:hypothetical protein L873DRAFT_1808426 [Choiromyces venosus 120613-1]|uniref:Uncharacterized protein n=1 Tax=Choiromyces venosus 120613-1 TaxID=1336337 RepID=A0A3N4JJH8_9PEZI|nr:hypothetical protein L873DRAFT_1808426 [Choiromyces venosus 120613-1]
MGNKLLEFQTETLIYRFLGRSDRLRDSAARNPIKPLLIFLMHTTRIPRFWRRRLNIVMERCYVTIS